MRACAVQKLQDAQTQQLQGGGNMFDVAGEEDSKAKVEALNKRVGKVSFRPCSVVVWHLLIALVCVSAALWNCERLGQKSDGAKRGESR